MKASRTAWTLAAAGAVLFAGAAWAQDKGAPETALQVSSRQEVNLSPAEMLGRARGYKPAMERASSSVHTQLAQARTQRDVVKSLCLSDKLSQIDLAIRTASDRIETLNGAVSQHDNDSAKHEFTVIEVLHDRVNTLVAESAQCIGEETGFVGDSHVTMTVDPSIPDTDPLDPGFTPIDSLAPTVTVYSPTH